MTALSRAVWSAAAMLCALTYAALLCGCHIADGHGLRAMSDRWCEKHSNPRPQCVQVTP